MSVDGNYVSRCYGFVSYLENESVQKAIEQSSQVMEKSEEGGSEPLKLSVCEYIPKLDRVGLKSSSCSTNLYVKNFPRQDEDKEFVEDQLRELFVHFGELISVAIMRDEGGKSKLFGFVCFKRSEDS